ncbi:MAG: DHHA1 domain-containing protein [Bacillota bacterium]|nr:DHHA1 domain-containing protein [Bacillota bacterium]
MKLFTDIDLDGFGCGLVAKLAYGEKTDISYCSYRNLNQRVENFLENPASKNNEIYITDLAVNENVEKKLVKRSNERHPIQIIDHHVTAMHFNQYKWALVKIEYEDGRKTCATSLFYDYLVQHHKLERMKSLEEFIDLVRQYDTWEWERNNNIAAKRLNDLFYILEREKFEEEILKRLRENPTSFSLSEKENLLLDIEEKKIERYIYSKSRQLVQTFVDGFCVGIVHAEQYLSELGNALNKLYPHLDMILLLNQGGKKVGFRTIHDHIDVSEYATRFGGGGHKKASGCEMTKEAFEKFVVNVFSIPPIKADPDHNEINVKETSYGTSYENQKGEFTYIRPNIDKGYEIIYDRKKLNQNFETFWDAEKFVKRNYNSWLRFDTEYVPYLCKELSINENSFRGDFKNIIKNHLNILVSNK